MGRGKGALGISGENDNGRRVADFCAERGLCVNNTYCEHESLYNYSRRAGGYCGVEAKSMIDLVMVRKDMPHYVQDVRAVRGMR